MINCPKCGSIADPYIEDVSYEFEETTAFIVYSYKCDCGARYSTITLYHSEKGEELMTEEDE